VTMHENQKALAIWKWAANVKLATQLTGYQIEIR
jgi:transcription antitermination factor NusA-like protein